MPGNTDQQNIPEVVQSLERRVAELERQVAELRPRPLPVPPPRPVYTPKLAAPPIAPPPRPVIPVAPQRSLEATIGQNWTAWIGAIVLVLGVLFFLKYAWDQGWIHPTPTMRIVAGIVTGAAISAVGEWMHWRRLRALAATLHGAGIAIVIASFFGAYVLFEPSQRVLGVSGAFAGVAITVGIGVALSLHINSIVLAIIALLGAYAAPVVLNTGEDHSLALLTYLGMLSAVAWVLMYLKPRWVPLRTLAWLGTYLLFAAWWTSMGRRNGYQTLGTVALAIYYVGFLAEMILTLRKTDDAARHPAVETAAAIMSLLNTAAAFGLLRALYREAAFDPTLGTVAVGLAVVQGLAAFATRSRAFALSSLLQSAALVTLAVPLLLDRFAITMGWTALAVALAGLAWELNIPAARGWAVVLLLLSIARLVAVDGRMRSVPAFWYGTFSVSQWMLMAWGMAMVAHLIAWLRPGQPGRFPSLERRFATVLSTGSAPIQPPPSVVLNYATPTPVKDTRGVDLAGVLVALLGTVVFAVSCGTQYDGSTLTFLWLLWLVPIVSLAHLGSQLGYRWHAAVVGLMVFMKWLFVDGMEPIARHWHNFAPADVLPPLVNAVVLNGLVLCGLIYGLILQSRRRAAPGNAAVYALAVWIALTALAMLNFEACRMVDWLAANGSAMRDPAIIKQMVMSVLWAVVGFSTIAVGFWKHVAPLRYAALALLGLTLMKILVVDMAEVKAVWRILSFIAVGALMLGVSYLYHRHMERRVAN